MARENRATLPLNVAYALLDWLADDSQPHLPGH